MAGQGQRGSRHHGRSSRPASPVVRAEAASAGEPGTEAITSMTSASKTPVTPSAALTPAPTPSPRTVSRLLQMKGMTPDEAANLTAFLYGLPTADLRWKLPELNQLLFLRDMRKTGHFGHHDGGIDLQP
jgi:hypothetical protein